MILGVPKLEIPDEVCDTCLIGKQPRTTFNSNTAHRSKDVLNVVYSDKCGLLEVPSLEVNKYFTRLIPTQRCPTPPSIQSLKRCHPDT